MKTFYTAIALVASSARALKVITESSATSSPNFEVTADHKPDQEQAAQIAVKTTSVTVLDLLEDEVTYVEPYSILSITSKLATL